MNGTVMVTPVRSGRTMSAPVRKHLIIEKM